MASSNASAQTKVVIGKWWNKKILKDRIMDKELLNNTSNIIIYQTEDGLTKIDVKIESDTVWLSQQQLVELYQSSKSNISEHIKHIFAEGELDKESVVRKFRTTAIKQTVKEVKSSLRGK
jgi:hypothetical protein